jgi:hypothetical protein
LWVFCGCGLGFIYSGGADRRKKEKTGAEAFSDPYIIAPAFMGLASFF